MSASHDEVAIVGAGLAGSLLACYLARRGHRVTLYERRADPRREDADEGRSINLALSVRGLDALERVGLAERVLAHALPMKGRMVHTLDGDVAFQAYSAEGHAINSIPRAVLNRLLLDAAEATGAEIRFRHRLETLDPVKGSMVFRDRPGEERMAEVVLGADGAYSAVRLRLQITPNANLEQEHLDYGYKELTIPPAADGGFALDPGALHIWPRGRSMMIALPNPDRSFTCTLFWPYDGPDGFAAVEASGSIRERLAERYPDAVPLMPDVEEEYRANPVGSLVTIRFWPWRYGRTALVGDAAHAIVPFYGQGANCAFEDCVELDRCLAAAGGDWDRALTAYAEARKPNTEAIADLALANFVEMRDKVASPLFRAGKRAEHALERLLPGRYMSLYELVSFSTVPYAEARRRAHRQRVAAVAAAGAALAGAGALVARGLRR